MAKGMAGAGIVVFAVGLLGSHSISALAQDNKWGAHIDFEAKPGSKRSLGEADLFVPLMQEDRWLLFGNLRARLDDESNREGNLGLGLRRMLEGGWNLGGYGYFDRRKSESGEYYSQVTLGGEALGRDWDLRANAYLPTGDRVRDLGSTGGDPTASISGTTVIVTTPATMTREERALRGFDAEAGWRLPLFDADEPRQLRLYAGGYRFEDDVTKVSGPRVRAELSLAEIPGLWRGAQLIGSVEAQDDSARGGQTFLSLRLRVPLGGDPERARQLNFQERRMTAPVMRDVDIVTQSRTFASSPELVETATVTASGQPFTVLNSATTTGAALPGAVAAAGVNSTVILSGTFNTTALVQVQDGQSLAGSIAVRTPSGHTAMTPSATIAATNANAVQLAGNNTLSGLTVTATFTGGLGGSGVLLNNTAGSINVLNNTITVMQTGANGAVGINVAANTNVVVSGNTVTVLGSGGATTLTALGVFGSTGVTASGNTLSASGGTTNRAASVTSSTLSSGSTNNVRSAGVCNSSGVNTGSISFTDGTTCP